jgi:hypothetical protein
MSVLTRTSRRGATVSGVALVLSLALSSASGLASVSAPVNAGSSSSGAVHAPALAASSHSKTSRLAAHAKSTASGLRRPQDNTSQAIESFASTETTATTSVLTPSMAAGRIVPAATGSTTALKTPPSPDGAVVAAPPSTLLPPPPASVSAASPAARRSGANVAPDVSGDPTLSAAFSGGDGGCGSYPAQPAVGIGPDDVVELTSCTLHIYNKSGTSLFHTPTSSWFDDGTTADERVLWDPIGLSFIAVNNAQDHLTITVSETSNPLGAWCTLQIPARAGGSSNLGDFPLVGIDPHFIWISNNVYNGSGDLVNSRLNAIPRSSLENCASSITYASFDDLYDPGTSTISYHIDPAIDLEGAVSSNTTESFFNVYGGGGSHLSIWWVNSSSASTSGLVISSARVSVPSYSDPPPVQEAGTSATLDPYLPTVNVAYEEPDSNVMIGWVSGYTSGGNSYSKIDWATASADDGSGSPYVFDDGSFGDPGYDYFYPALGYDVSLNGLAAYALSGESIYPSSAFVGISNEGELSTSYYAEQGTYPYSGDTGGDSSCSGCSRWGDWYSVSMNTTGDRFWLASELATDNGTMVDTYPKWWTSIADIDMNDD